ncbi:MAG: hypothetical protein GVY32_03395 [Gammaproteobacteria bacterium]|jgi:hypothetical protein|nr:hypothetical protein [Gammaproteobacteria bacterium]
MRKLMIILLTGFVAACAASGEYEPRDRADEVATYEFHAGAAESWVRYTSIRNWWSVGFGSVVFEMDRSRHYLVDLAGACDLDLHSATTLRVVSDRRNVLSEFDDVIVNGRTCQVRSIRQLDYEAVKAELEADAMPDKKDTIDVATEDQSSGGT